MDCFLALRGTKTLPLRMRQHDANGRVIAEWLSERKDVQKVYYPGLPSHPQHELAKKQMSGFGGMISFEVGDVARARRIVERTEALRPGRVAGRRREPDRATRPRMTHASVPPAMRASMGLTD